jgi:hypothetical protein
MNNQHRKKIVHLYIQTGVGDRFFRRSSMTLRYSRCSTEGEIFVRSVVPMPGLSGMFVAKTLFMASCVTPL